MAHPATAAPTATTTSTVTRTTASLHLPRPRLRGRLHAAAAPLVLAAGIALVALAPAGVPRLGSAVFAASALELFTVSAVLHRGGWSPRTEALLTRLDHASIFVLIAGTYTPFALLLLDGPSQAALLGIAWGGAALGIAFRLVRPHAGRWVYTPVYMVLGCAAVAFVPQFAEHAADARVVDLIVAGGLLYFLGGVVYGLRRPNPFPAWFGFHEVFHSFTVIAFAAHFAGVGLAAGALR